MAEEATVINDDSVIITDRNLAVYLIWIQKFRCRLAARNAAGEILYGFEDTADLRNEIDAYDNYNVNVNLHFFMNALDEEFQESTMI